jgi:hypothetical protein
MNGKQLNNPLNPCKSGIFSICGEHRETKKKSGEKSEKILLAIHYP